MKKFLLLAAVFAFLMFIGIAILAVFALFLYFGQPGAIQSATEGEAPSSPGLGNLFGLAPSSPSELTIGWIGPLTGEHAPYGQGIKNGVELAKKEFSNLTVRIIYEDSGCTEQGASVAMNKLITTDRVQAVIGDACDAATLAASQLAEQNQIALISPVSGASGTYSFSISPSGTSQGDFGASLLFDNGFRRLAILHDETGLSISNSAKSRFQSLGGTVVATQTFQSGATSLDSQLSSIRDEEPDSLFLITGSQSSAVSALNKITSLGLDVAVIGSDRLMAQPVLDEAGASSEGLTVLSLPSGNSNFTSRHLSALGSAPGPYAAQGYDSFALIATAIQNGARTGPQIRDALQSMEYEGESGLIKFGQNSNSQASFAAYVVRGGEFVRSDSE